MDRIKKKNTKQTQKPMNNKPPYMNTSSLYCGLNYKNNICGHVFVCLSIHPFGVLKCLQSHYYYLSANNSKAVCLK